MNYVVIYEQSENGWGTCVPDLPGLRVAGSTLEQTKQLIREANVFRIEGLKQAGDPVPEPKVFTEYVKV